MILITALLIPIQIKKFLSKKIQTNITTLKRKKIKIKKMNL